MENIFNDLQAVLQQGKAPALTLGIIANTNDPENLRRIQCLDSGKNGRSLTPWLSRVTFSDTVSAPVPPVGAVAVIGYIDGDPHSGVWFGLLNTKMMPPIGDIKKMHVEIGNTALSLSVDETVLTSPVIRETSDEHTFNASSVAINGKQIATIGAVDDDGDDLVSRGW
jgi:hypothetical protein